MFSVAPGRLVRPTAEMMTAGWVAETLIRTLLLLTKRMLPDPGPLAAGMMKVSPLPPQAGTRIATTKARSSRRAGWRMVKTPSRSGIALAVHLEEAVERGGNPLQRQGGKDLAVSGGHVRAAFAKEDALLGTARRGHADPEDRGRDLPALPRQLPVLLLEEPLAVQRIHEARQLAGRHPHVLLALQEVGEARVGGAVGREADAVDVRVDGDDGLSRLGGRAALFRGLAARERCQ